MKKSILSMVAVLVLALSFTACKKEKIGTGYIQFINASELSSPLDFYVSDSKKNTTALAYTQYTNYFSVSSKQQPANIKIALTGQAVFNFDVTPLDGLYYSVFYVSEGTAVAYQDNLVTPETGKARVRFINLNAGVTTKTDFGVAGGTKIVSDLELGQNSSYYNVAPNTTFAAYVAGQTTELKNIPTTLEAGHIYTIYLSGKDQAGLQANVVLQR